MLPETIKMFDYPVCEFSFSRVMLEGGVHCFFVAPYLFGDHNFDIISYLLAIYLSRVQIPNCVLKTIQDFRFVRAMRAASNFAKNHGVSNVWFLIWLTWMDLGFKSILERLVFEKSYPTH